jgi:hypothetical protein
MREIHRPENPASIADVNRRLYRCTLPGELDHEPVQAAPAWRIFGHLGSLGPWAMRELARFYLPMQNELKIAPSRLSLV